MVCGHICLSIHLSVGPEVASPTGSSDSSCCECECSRVSAVPACRSLRCALVQMLGHVVLLGLFVEEWLLYYGSVILHFHQQYTRGSPPLLFPCLFLRQWLINMGQVTGCGLDFISLMISDVLGTFTHSLHTWLSCETCLLTCFAHLLITLVICQHQLSYIISEML